jgi:hypothetical protein
MNEFIDYVNGINSYSETLKNVSFPLMSWDFHMQNINNISDNFSDVKAIKGIKSAFNWNYSADFENELQKGTVILVTNAKLEIIFSTQNIVKMNGYKSDEIIGQTPKMFQGPATCKNISAEIRDAINLKVPFDKWVLNYKKNGDLYNCHIKGFPIFDKQGNLCNFIAFERAA